LLQTAKSSLLIDCWSKGPFRPTDHSNHGGRRPAGGHEGDVPEAGDSGGGGAG